MPSTPIAGAFEAFDEHLASGAVETGVIIVRAPGKAHAAILAHASRRLRAHGHEAIEIAGDARLGTPIFREAATRLALTELPSEPSACAELITREATARRAVLLVPMPEAGAWDHAVATQLAQQARSLLLVLVTENHVPAWDDSSRLVFELCAELTPEDKRRWTSAVVDDAHNGVPGTELFMLESWWSSARRAAPDAKVPLDSVDALGQSLLCCLALAGRSLRRAALATLGGDVEGAVSRLVARGLASSVNDRVLLSSSIEPSLLEPLITPESYVTTARLLAGESHEGSDPWADARAAELLLAAGSFDGADDAIGRAMRSVEDAQASDEIGRRWFEAVLALTGESGLMLRTTAAHRALDMGEAHDAQRWCESAMSLAPEDPSIALLMGRVLIQLGDLVAARVYLQKAQRGAKTEELYARVIAELAEVSYHAADLEEATAYANTAIALAATGSTRLAARNTLGKIHLGAGAWDVCDEHFADDATTARSCGDRMAELRARVNRGIALLSKGLLEDARAVLEQVLEDGTSFGEHRARAYALHNLAVIAEQQHDYGRALEHWEASARYPVTLCGRISSARMLANLADLRLRLGLVAHADHTIAFGRRVLGARSSTGAAAEFGIVAARVALARGNSTLARREIDRALVDAEKAGETARALPQALLVSARVAIEDGDLHGASAAISTAEARATSRRDRTELALLKALHRRAMGSPALDAAMDALRAARAGGEEDLLIEIHTLLGTLHRDAGALDEAQAHCSRGLSVRDQIAFSLAQETRTAFLDKAELRALSRLQTSLAGEQDDAREQAPRNTGGQEPRPALEREIIGDDPQIRHLIASIRKVARSSSMVLIYGESGTGKELVAHALHRASERAAGPLVTVNCAALVETLLLSELFGHEKGAFTGAASRRRGRFELAEGGTLFLDEIGDISARTQVALLRVLQEKTFERVGGSQPLRANVRVVCASHRDLKAMVERGEFREDLYYRLRGITLEVPALRSRLGDLPMIAHHLLRRIAAERNEAVKQLAPEALELLQRHRWPGNIRELENVLRAASLFADGDVITSSNVTDNVEDLRAVAQAGSSSRAPLWLRESAPPPSGDPASSSSRAEHDDDADSSVPAGESSATEVAYAQVRRGATSLSGIKRQIERDCIARALMETNGNITHAAALLGVKRPRLSQLVKQYGLSTTEVSK